MTGGSGEALLSSVHRQSQTVIPDELRYLEVCKVTSSDGTDALVNAAKDPEQPNRLPATVTFYATEEQALKLAEVEQNGELHIVFLARGDGADVYIPREQRVLAEEAPATPAPTALRRRPTATGERATGTPTQSAAPATATPGATATSPAQIDINDPEVERMITAIWGLRRAPGKSAIGLRPGQSVRRQGYGGSDRHQPLPAHPSPAPARRAAGSGTVPGAVPEPAGRQRSAPLLPPAPGQQGAVLCRPDRPRRLHGFRDRPGWPPTARASSLCAAARCSTMYCWTVPCSATTRSLPAMLAPCRDRSCCLSCRVSARYTGSMPSAQCWKMRGRWKSSYP